ncbi:oxidoreductase [Cohnella sp. GCM10020058]|uniref:oxidoreductase n=1 Tax=Cohnella sp. GCM10020058 TaxID=3317330 RepID=UPI003626DFB3
MTNLNFLETRLSSRYGEDVSIEENKTVFADLIIDSISLYQRLKEYDFVPAFGWGKDEQQQLTIDYFLFKYPFEFKYHRYPILICPQCGDLECGYISVAIDKESDIVEWSNFYLEHNNQPLDIGPFHFKWDNYKLAIEKTYEIGRLR